MADYNITFNRNGSTVQVRVNTQQGYQAARQIAEGQKPAGYTFASLKSK